MNAHRLAGTRLLDYAAVGVGGAIGTAARIGLESSIRNAVGSLGGLPLGMLTINLVGALLLGVVYTVLVARELTTPRAQRFRAFLGVGCIGGFTSYSALATAAASMVASGQWMLAAGYGLGTVVLGAGATWVGVLIGQAMRRRWAA